MREYHAIPRPALLIAGLVLLPFPVLLILIWAQPAAASLDRLVLALSAYAAVVLALMGGAHWALATGPYGHSRIAVEWLIGFAALLAAWLSLNVPAHFGLSVLIAGFFLLALRDALMAEAAAIALWFARLRSYICAGAIVTSILALIRVIT